MSWHQIDFSQRRAFGLAALLVASSIFIPCASAATMRFDNGGGTGLWETPANWDETTSPDTLPGAGDIADISNSFTVGVSSAQSVSEVIVGWPNGATATNPGTATLNVGSGANIQVSSSNGMRVGRLMKTGQLAGSSKGIVNQTGGTVQINSGTNGLRLSQGDSNATTPVADSVYNISGGSVRGGPTNGSMTAPLQIGLNTNLYNLSEFHMIGSGVTEARFEDVRIQGNAGGQTNLHFSLDNGGVTPLIAEDEMRFVGTNTNSLIVDLIGLPPQTDITLITADRLNTASSAPSETFTGLPDGSPISASFGGTTYNWLLRYQDGSDNGVLDAFVKLQFVSVTQVPEPASFALMGLVCVALALFGRRGR
jgi:hypothetical protein